MSKLCVLFGNNISSKLTQFFTGSRAYHTFWLTNDYVYDMHLIRRRRPFYTYLGCETIEREFPDITQAYLEERLTNDNSWYGVKDYCLFLLRPLYHLFGKSTRNCGGVICSEMCNIDLRACGYPTPWDLDKEPPSPGDFEKWFKE